jgi:hypothetical protein
MVSSQRWRAAFKSSMALDNFGIISESSITNSRCSKPGERVTEARQLVAVIPIQTKLFNKVPGHVPVSCRSNFDARIWGRFPCGFVGLCEEVRWR